MYGCSQEIQQQDEEEEISIRMEKVAFFILIRSKVPLTLLEEKKTGSQKLFPDLSLYI